MLQVLRNSAVIWEYLANRTPYHTRPSLRGLEQKPWLICHCNWNKFHSTYSTEVCLKSTYTIIGEGLMYWSSKLPGGYWHSLYLVAVAHRLTPFGHRFGIPLLENWKVTITKTLTRPHGNLKQKFSHGASIRDTRIPDRNPREVESDSRVWSSKTRPRISSLLSLSLEVSKHTLLAANQINTPLWSIGLSG